MTYLNVILTVTIIIMAVLAVRLLLLGDRVRRLEASELERRMRERRA